MTSTAPDDGEDLDVAAVVGRTDAGDIAAWDDLLARLHEGHNPTCGTCGAVDSAALMHTDQQLITTVAELVNVIEDDPVGACRLVRKLTENAADGRRVVHLLAEELAARSLTPLPPAPD